MKKSVYLIQSPPFWLKTPPLSLTYLKTFLEAKGIKVGISDLNQKLFFAFERPTANWLNLNETFEQNLFSCALRDRPALFKQLLKEIDNFDFVGFSILKRNTRFALSLAKYIKEIFPDKKIVIGGPQALTLDKYDSLNKQYSWVTGEGELALLDILIDNRRTIHRFKEINCLDSLPFYNFDSFDLKNYSNVSPLLSSRGCPYLCSFCSEKFLYKKFRFHSPAYIKGQIIYLLKKGSSKYFVFLDSLINYNNDWLYEFCESLLKKNLKIKWEAQMRVNGKFPLELAKLMKQSGCYNLFVGLESACDKILKVMNKGFTADQALDFFRILKTADLNFETSLIFGYPQENNQDFLITKEFIIKNKNVIPKIAQVNPFTDYLDEFPADSYPSKDGKNRVKKFLKVLEKEKIKHTKNFINNLIY